MKILIIGDIYGQIGKDYIVKNLKKIKKKYNPNLVIANAENVSVGGKSLSRKDYTEIIKSGIDYITMGNHTFRNPEFEKFVGRKNNIVRPGNAWVDKPGVGSLIIESNDKKILLINVLGQAFMPGIDVYSPFDYIQQELKNNDFDFSIVD